MNWYCIHTQNLREHVAEANIRRLSPDIDTFFPRFKLTGNKSLTRTESPLFPTYIFARLDPDQHFGKYNSIEQAHGVSRVVEFGGVRPVIPDSLVAALRSEFLNNGIKEVRNEFRKNDPVTITDGALKGLDAVVSHEIPAKERVAVLVEMLASIQVVHVPAGDLQHQIQRHPLVRSVNYEKQE